MIYFILFNINTFGTLTETMAPSQKSAYLAAKLAGTRALALAGTRAGKPSSARKLFPGRPLPDPRIPLSEGFPSIGQTHRQHALQHAVSNPTLKDMSPMTP